MSLNPPLCMLVYYGDIFSAGTNLYSTTLNITYQYYNQGGSQYDGTTLTVGMWTTNSLDGIIFRIYGISNQTADSVDVILEDVSGVNALINPQYSPIGSGGGPVPNSNGYVFELNPNGLPALTAIDAPPTVTFSDSILGRYILTNPPQAEGWWRNWSHWSHWNYWCHWIYW